MDQREKRLAGCFLAVFPDLSMEEVVKASSNSVRNWDSVAGVTLLATVEEEFGISIELEELERFNSFSGFMGYLQEIDHSDQVPRDTYAV
jgi:acyl carrier protein